MISTIFIEKSLNIPFRFDWLYFFDESHFFTKNKKQAFFQLATVHSIVMFDQEMFVAYTSNALEPYTYNLIGIHLLTIWSSKTTMLGPGTSPLMAYTSLYRPSPAVTLFFNSVKINKLVNVHVCCIISCLYDQSKYFMFNSSLISNARFYIVEFLVEKKSFCFVSQCLTKHFTTSRKCKCMVYKCPIFPGKYMYVFCKSINYVQFCINCVGFQTS